jgi:Icc-related predicted phosphoesterase
MGDLHCTDKSRGAFQPLFGRVAESAQVAVLCGDLTDHGLASEARVLAEEIQANLRIPVLAVLGNHDFESGQEDQVRHILEKAGVMFLDGEAREVAGIGFAGAKGFAGGFGRGTLGSFGEKIVKLFVQEAIDEAMKLEAALSRLRTSAKIAVLHYAPIQATVENEPVQIFPFLGCGRLEEPLNRFQVTACIHGHAHNGAPEGKTTGGVPVYNVSLPLMRKLYPNNPPFRILEVAVQARPAAPAPATPLNAAAMTEAPVHSPVG